MIFVKLKVESQKSKVKSQKSKIYKLWTPGTLELWNFHLVTFVFYLLFF